MRPLVFQAMSMLGNLAEMRNIKVLRYQVNEPGGTESEPGSGSESGSELEDEIKSAGYSES